MNEQEKGEHRRIEETSDPRQQVAASETKRQSEDERLQVTPTERRHMEEQLRRAQAEWLEEKQRFVHLLALHDRHQQLIGYEIHDGLAQLLTAAVMQLGKVKASWNGGAPEARKELDSGCELVEQSLLEARRLINGLRSTALQDVGLVLAVGDLIYQVSSNHAAPQVEFVHKVSFERLPAPLESTLFRIVQESLTNACRHSKSERVRIELRQQGDALHIEVRDWGIGFDPAKVKEDRFGLESIQERARLFGGQATITSAPGRGTVIGVDLPLGVV